MVAMIMHKLTPLVHTDATTHIIILKTIHNKSTHIKVYNRSLRESKGAG